MWYKQNTFEISYLKKIIKKTTFDTCVFVCVLCVPLSLSLSLLCRVPHGGSVTRRNFEKIVENFMKTKEFGDFWEFQGAIHPVLCPPVEKTLSCVYV